MPPGAMPTALRGHVLPEAIVTQRRGGQSILGDDDLKLSGQIWQDNPTPDGNEGSHAHAKATPTMLQY